MVGLVTTMPRERAESQVLRMVEALAHEPFYVTGTWAAPALGVYVGWVAHKDSFADGMPLTNERGDVSLVFSGEEFPHPSTVRGLRERGHRVDATGASYLVHVYEEDQSFPAGLNGRFHGIVTDRTRGTATLFNDRYGMHRLYYHRSPEAFLFAAEAKAILAVRPECRRVDPRGLGELVACGCVLDNRSLFTGVHVLPGGAAWVFRHGAIARPGTYFDRRQWEEQTSLPPEAYYEELRDVFSRNLGRYFSAPPPVGMSLTGGLDTRMVMAWQTPAPGTLPCYTFGGHARDCRDVTVARRVARVCGQPHEVIAVDQDFLARFGEYAERTVYLTDGCADVSRSPDLYVNERARDIAPVRMTGNYGGEVLRQVRAFKPMEPLPGLFRPELLAAVGEARETYARAINGHPLSFAVFRQAPWHHHGLLALEQTQVSLRSPYLDNDFVRTVFRAPPSALADSAVSLRLIADGSPGLLAIETDRGLGGRGARPWAALRRLALELSFKAEYAYDYGMPQALARADHHLSRFHPERLFLGRHKFYHFRVWYRDALARYVRHILLDPRALARPYVERRRLEAIVSDHTAGRRNYTSAIHKALTLELIHRAFVDQA